MLIGRDTEIEELRDALRRVRKGASRCVVLTAEAGLGKTTLLDAVATDAIEAGFVVLHAKADELEQDRPFGVLRRCLGDLGEEGRRIEIVLAEASAGRTEGGWIEEPELRFRIIDRTVETLDRMLAEAPVALVIDDYQWVDEPSATATTTLLRRLADRPLLLLIAARLTTSASPVQALLDRVPDATERTLAPLDPDAVAALVAEVTDGDGGDEMLRRARRAGGNPFLIKELVASATDRPGSDDSPSLPDTLQRQLLSQLAELDDDTRQMLRIAAVIGSSFTAAQIAELAGTALSTVATQVDTALRARVLVSQGRRLDFRHDLWREVVYADTPQPVRAALHLAVGRLLSDQGVPASDVATHVIRGAEVGDLSAVELLRSAAAELGRVAPATATRLLEHAARLLPEHHHDRLPVMVELIQAYVFTGQLERASRLAEEHLAGSLTEDLELGLRNARSQVYFLRGDAALAATEFEAMVPLVAGRAREAIVLADAAISATFAIDLPAADQLSQRSLDVAADHGEKVAPLAYGVRSWLASFTADLQSGLALATEAVTAADAAPGLEGHRRLPHLFHAQVLLWADRVADAHRSLERGRRLSTELGMGWDEPMYQALLADHLLRAGESDDALAEAEAGVLRAEEVGSYFALPWLYAHQARIHLWRNDVARAGQLVDVALSGPGDGGQALDQLWHLRGLIAALSGDSDTAGLIWSTLWSKLDELGVGLRQLEVAADVVRHAGTADRPLADRVCTRVDAIAAEHDSPLAQATAAWCRALSTHDPDLALAAVEHTASREHPVDLARCRGDAATILLQAGRDSEAHELAAAAGDTFDTLGAPALAALHLGDRFGRNRPSRPSTSGWDALTRSERKVVELVSKGMSNAEIADRLSISRRTVESHLYHAYPKLGLSNRVELAVFAAGQS